MNSIIISRIGIDIGRELVAGQIEKEQAQECTLLSLLLWQTIDKTVCKRIPQVGNPTKYFQ